MDKNTKSFTPLDSLQLSACLCLCFVCVCSDCICKCNFVVFFSFISRRQSNHKLLLLRICDFESAYHLLLFMIKLSFINVNPIQTRGAFEAPNFKVKELQNG